MRSLYYSSQWLLLSLLLFLLLSSARANILSTFQDYENIRANATQVTRVGSIDVVELPDGTSIPYCHLAMVMPFSRVYDDTGREAVDLGVFQGQASVMLAIEHLNTGNGTLVPELEGLDQRCPIKFTAEIFDSAYSQTDAVDTVINLISRQPGVEGMETEDHLAPKKAAGRRSTPGWSRSRSASGDPAQPGARTCVQRQFAADVGHDGARVSSRRDACDYLRRRQ